MAQALDEAKRERELTKESLAANLDRLESRVRQELDWKARLRRDGPRYAVFGGMAVTGLVAALVLRKRAQPPHPPSVRERFHLTSFEDLAAELQGLRASLERAAQEGRKASPPLWQKAMLRGVTAAGAAAGTLAARHIMERFAPGPLEQAAEHSAHPDR